MKKVYVASSWRNDLQIKVVEELKLHYDVYDFRRPAPGLKGFSWAEIDPKWQEWSGLQKIHALEHGVAVQGFALDMTRLALCDACVLVMPCGRSAHLELGYAVGAGKFTVVLLDEKSEPELMYSMVSLVTTSLVSVKQALSRL